MFLVLCAAVFPSCYCLLPLPLIRPPPPLLPACWPQVFLRWRACWWAGKEKDRAAPMSSVHACVHSLLKCCSMVMQLMSVVVMQCG